MRKLFVLVKSQNHNRNYLKSFQWNGTAESLFIRFPDKAQTDKLGLHLAWTILINIPKKS